MSKPYVQMLACLALATFACGASFAQGKTTEIEIDGQAEKPALSTPYGLEATEDVKLAELHFEDGQYVMFSFNEVSGDYGLLQKGPVGLPLPRFLSGADSLLEVFLDITPENLPIPKLLLAEPTSEAGVPAAAATRRISSSRVTAGQLTMPQALMAKYYPWHHWTEGPTAGMAPKTYYSSSFVGKANYSDSYICNHTPAGSPSWLTARHRIYYKNAFGNYVKQYESSVAPWTCEAKTKGSIKRYRRVIYDDAWGASLNCGNLAGIVCKYFREGRFRD